MSQELHYTSSPRGLKPGSKGFCTVASTPNMSGPLAERLEGLSGYRQVFPPHDPSAPMNPVVLSHLRMVLGGKSLHILSRIGFAGLDYTERANKYAHHIVLEDDERPIGGPAWVMSQEGVMQATWEGPPSILASGRRPPRGDRPPGVCQAWQARVGDAGWAGVLAEAFLADPLRPSYLVFEPGMDLLPLFVEAIALLSPSRRWEVTFSTYFTTLPQGIACSWRGVLDGSPEAKQARRLPDALVIDLCRPIGPALGGALAEQARTGEFHPTALETTLPEADEVEAHAESRPTIPLESSDRRRRSMVAAAYEVIPELPGEGGPSSRRSQRSAHGRGRRWQWLIAACLFVVTGLGLVTWYVNTYNPSVQDLLREARKAPSGPGGDSIKGKEGGPNRLPDVAIDNPGGNPKSADSAVATPAVPESPANKPLSNSTVVSNQEKLADSPVGDRETPASPAPQKTVYKCLSINEPISSSSFGPKDETPQAPLEVNPWPPKSFELIGHEDKALYGSRLGFRRNLTREYSITVFVKKSSNSSFDKDVDLCDMSCEPSRVIYFWKDNTDRRAPERDAFRDCAVRIVTASGSDILALLQDPGRGLASVPPLKGINLEKSEGLPLVFYEHDIFKANSTEPSPILKGTTKRSLAIREIRFHSAKTPSPPSSASSVIPAELVSKDGLFFVTAGKIAVNLKLKNNHILVIEGNKDSSTQNDNYLSKKKLLRDKQDALKKAESKGLQEGERYDQGSGESADQKGPSEVRDPPKDKKKKQVSREKLQVDIKALEQELKAIESDFLRIHSKFACGFDVVLAVRIDGVPVDVTTLTILPDVANNKLGR